MVERTEKVIVGEWDFTSRLLVDRCYKYLFCDRVIAAAHSVVCITGS